MVVVFVSWVVVIVVVGLVVVGSGVLVGVVVTFSVTVVVVVGQSKTSQNISSVVLNWLGLRS